MSTGLARPDALDWPAKFRSVIPSVHPDIVIVTFGGNDAAGSGRSRWQLHRRSAHRRTWRRSTSGGPSTATRVGAVMDYLSAEGRTVIWVGIPNDDNPDVPARMQRAGRGGACRGGQTPAGEVRRHVEAVLRPRGQLGRVRHRSRDGQGKDVTPPTGSTERGGRRDPRLDIADVVRQELRNRGAQF